MHPKIIRLPRITVAVAGPALALGFAVLGAGTAAAQSAPNVVGMSEHAAVEVLNADDVPFSIVNRAGSPAGYCAVTAQRDRGYRTVVESEYDYEDGEFDRVERQVWRGVALTVVCR